MSNKKIFLLDTNIFITPFKTYYQFDFAPTFWDFLKTNIENGNIAVLSKVYDEILKGKDRLSNWITTVKFTKINHSDNDIVYEYSQVLSHIQNGKSKTGGKLYNDNALYGWSNNNIADAWLVATAKARNYVLTTLEKPNGSLGNSISGRPKIPDVASALNVESCDLYEMIRILGFIFK